MKTDNEIKKEAIVKRYETFANKMVVSYSKKK